LRRIILLCCIASLATLGLASIARAAETTTLGIKLSSTKAKANSKMTVLYTNTTTEPIDTAPFQSHIVVWFPKGAKVDFKDFPSCTVPASARVPASCNKARLGPGTLHSEGRLQDNHNVLGAMNVFNGGGNVLYLPVVITQPADIVVYVKGVLTKATGKYGYKLDVSFKIPVILPDTKEPYIKNFNIGPIGAFKTVKGKQVSFIQNPSTCSSAGWAFKMDTTYNDNTTSSASTTVKCKK
jgi:hypothetical protein